MFRTLILLVTLFTFSVVHAQDFEGIIEFKTTTGTNTESSVWYVKDNRVRVDVFEPGTRMLKGCHLINTNDSSIQYLDHKAKTFGRELTTAISVRVDTKVTKSEGSKEILTYEATESTITYNDGSGYSCWISGNKFGFFRTAIRILGGNNDYYAAYWSLNPEEGAMPLLMIRKNAKGEETGRFEAVRIEKRSIDAALFNIPADYKQTGGIQLPPGKRE